MRHRARKDAHGQFGWRPSGAARNFAATQNYAQGWWPDLRGSMVAIRWLGVVLVAAGGALRLGRSLCSDTGSAGWRRSSLAVNWSRAATIV